MPNNVTLDTNVLIHLFNPQNNDGEHIDALLKGLVAQKRSVCVDRRDGQEGRIESEYKHYLVPIIKARSNEGARMELLKYFLVIADKDFRDVDFASALGVSIRNTMNAVGAEPSDHVFAYVTCAANSPMVTNNTPHFPRQELRQCAQAHGSSETDFYTTQEAIASLI